MGFFTDKIGDTKNIWIWCSSCKGKGENEDNDGDIWKCTSCKGKGEVYVKHIFTKCSGCNGTGTTRKKSPFQAQLFIGPETDVQYDYYECLKCSGKGVCWEEKGY